MSDISKLKVNNLFNIDLKDLLTVDIDKSSLSLDILNLEDLTEEEFDECLYYWKKSRELFKLNKQLYYEMFITLNITNEDILKTLSTVKPKLLYPYIMMSFFFYYIYNKKIIKNEIKRRWAYSKTIVEATKSMPLDESIKLVDSIRTYFIFKALNKCKSLKEFYIIQKLNPDNLIVFNKFRNIYRGFFQNF